MTMTQGDGGGGGLGTAGSICTISPADNEAIINNLIARIEKLEFDLSQITGANLHAGTLGDLSSQVGWVYGVEYMGIPGWTQTEYGTLIPPAGFTLSGSGFQMFNACTGEYEDYQGVVMDSDGVLQFGFTDKGNLCGEKVEAWNNATIGTATNDYARATSTGAGFYTANRGATITSTTLTSGVNAVASVNMAVTTSGLYHISADVVLDILSPTAGDPCGASLIFRVLKNGSSASPGINTTQNKMIGMDSANVNKVHFQLHGHASLDGLYTNGDTIGLFAEHLVGTGGATIQYTFANLSIHMVSG